MVEILASKLFTTDDQRWFAAVSHDANPMHVDPVAARRTQYGVPVAHGMHVVLWALDRFFLARPEFRPGGLHVLFSKPVLSGDAVTLAVASERAQDLTLECSVGRASVATIRLTSGAPRGIVGIEPDLGDGPGLPKRVPVDLPPDGLAGQKGGVIYDGAAVDSAFPAVIAALGAGAAAGLAASSYVVGMECPGLHSIFSSLTAMPCRDAGPGTVRFRVLKYDPRFRSLQIAFKAPGIAAMLGALARIPPIRQPGIDAVRLLVRDGEFAGRRALVVGGSRGIGEATAKLLAAGGARIAITYAVGAAEAERVVEEIRAAGGEAQALRYDVRQPAAPQLAELAFDPDSVYYFATPPVFRRKLALYEPGMMHDFITYYVDGFGDLCLALRARSAVALAVFYPSTVAANEPVRDLAEYSAAKVAGEILAAHLTRFAEGVRVITRRLPRIETDLTASVAMADAASAVDVMLPVIREMQQHLT